MKINIICAVLFFLLLIFPIGYNSQLENILTSDGYKYSIFILITVLSICIIYKCLIIKRSKRDHPIFNFIFIIVFGFISSQIIGEQTHDVRSGAMAAFGPPLWIYFLCYFYPISFLIFIYFLSRIDNKIISALTLIIWNMRVIWTGYFHYNPVLDKLGEDYDGLYFPSDSRLITPILIASIGFMILFVLLRDIFIKQQIKNE